EKIPAAAEQAVWPAGEAAAPTGDAPASWTDEPVPPLTALPESVVAEEQPRSRRRSRGGPRRRRSSAPDQPLEASPDPAPLPPEGGPGDEPSPPHVMDAAEHRTTEPAEGPRSTPQLSSSPTAGS